MKKIIGVLLFSLFSTYGWAAENSIVGWWELDYVGCQDVETRVISKSEITSVFANLVMKSHHEFTEGGAFATEAWVPLTCKVTVSGEYKWENNILFMKIEATEKIDGSVFSCPSEENNIGGKKGEKVAKVEVEGDVLYFYDTKPEGAGGRCEGNSLPVQVFKKVN